MTPASPLSRILSALIRADRTPFAIVALVVWLVCTAGIRPLMLPDEGRYVGIAWEMLAGGNWLVPFLDGMPFFHKPPLFYWIEAAGMALFGVNLWAARLASLLAASLAAAGTLLFLRRHANAQLATMTVVVLVTQPFFFIGAQFANLDMLVAGLISLSILSGGDALLRQEHNQSWRLAMARTFVLAGFGVLAKGLIGFVLPGGVLFLWTVWRRHWRGLSAIFWFPGILLFLAVALPWFLWMQHLYPGFFDYFVIYHHIQRFSQTGFNNQMPFWFYVPVIFLFAVPWSPWAVKVCRISYWRDPQRGALRSLMAIWLLVILAFFSLPSSKLVGYILPVLPPFAYFVAEPFSFWIAQNPARGRRWYGITLAVAAVFCITIVVGVRLADKESASPLAQAIRSEFSANDQLVMVDVYQYDLPFYLRTTLPAWVISRWSDPEISRKDNWRKELFDAGKFDPSVAQLALVSANAFTARICETPRQGTLWFWGTRDAKASLPLLETIETFGTNRKYAVWRLTPEQLRSLPACAGKPTNG